MYFMIEECQGIGMDVAANLLPRNENVNNGHNCIFIINQRYM